MSCGCVGECGCDTPILPEGPPGEGIQGPVGPVGPGATVAVGTTTGVPYGNAANVTNTGTPGAAVLNFEIPEGASPYDLALANGFVGTEVQWLASLVGADGNSAYQTAIDEGSFTGTLAQFAVSFWPRTTTTANFTVPASAASVTISVESTYQMVPGGYLYVQGIGWFLVGTVFTFTSVSITNPAGIINAAPGTIVNAGTSINAAGPQGPTGNTGPAGVGTTPVLRSGTLVPSNALGVDGDWYIQQVNPGKWQVYAKQSGFYVAFATGQITANRLIGYSTVTADPNSLGLSGVNANDQYWTQIGTTMTMWVYNGATWVVAIQFTTGGGGGGGDTFTTVAANSSVGAYGQLTGTTYNWMLEKTIFFAGINATHTVDFGTYQFDLSRPKTNLSLLANVTLNHTAMGGDGEWTFDIINAAGTSKQILYSSGVWTVIPGLAYPTFLSAGERVQLICRKHSAKICITQVIANVSTIP